MYLRKFIYILLIFSLSFNSLPLSLKIKKAKTIYNEDQSILIPDRVIPAGTIIHIPDEFIDKNFSGSKKDEMSIINWLASAENLDISTFEKSNGSTGKDFFIEVEIPEENIKRWISLRVLAKKNGIEFETKKESDIYQRVKINELFYNVSPSRVLEIDNNQLEFCPISQDNSELLLLASLSDDTNDIISNLLNRIQKESFEDLRNRKDADSVIANFNKTCKNFEFKTFYQELKKQTLDKNIPTDVLLSIMTQETAGNCTLIRDENDDTTSSGLFQINSDSSDYEVCKDIAIALKDKNCLNHPQTNLAEAVRILASKYKSVNGDYPEGKSTYFIDLERNERDRWRKAISAYNGGQVYIFRAHDEIMEFNRIYETNLDPEDWETRQIFMLRSLIEKRKGKLFDKKANLPSTRSRSSTLSNLIYTHSVVSRENDLSENQHLEKWDEFIQAH